MYVGATKNARVLCAWFSRIVHLPLFVVERALLIDSSASSASSWRAASVFVLLVRRNRSVVLPEYCSCPTRNEMHICYKSRGSLMIICALYRYASFSNIRACNKKLQGLGWKQSVQPFFGTPPVLPGFSPLSVRSLSISVIANMCWPSPYSLTTKVHSYLGSALWLSRCFVLNLWTCFVPKNLSVLLWCVMHDSTVALNFLLFNFPNAYNLSNCKLFYLSSSIICVLWPAILIHP